MKERVIDVSEKWEYDFFCPYMQRFFNESKVNEQIMVKYIEATYDYIRKCQSIHRDWTPKFSIKSIAKMNQGLKYLIATNCADLAEEMDEMKTKTKKFADKRLDLKVHFRSRRVDQLRGELEKYQAEKNKCEAEYKQLDRMLKKLKQNGIKTKDDDVARHLNERRKDVAQNGLQQLSNTVQIKEGEVYQETRDFNYKLRNKLEDFIKWCEYNFPAEEKNDLQDEVDMVPESEVNLLLERLQTEYEPIHPGFCQSECKDILKDFIAEKE